MDKQSIIIIFGMSLVTYLPRVLPVVILSKIKIPDWFMRWLRYIPSAVLSALLVPEIMFSEEVLDLSLKNKNILAAIPCFVIAYKTKNLFITVIAGIISMLLLNILFVSC